MTERKKKLDPDTRVYSCPVEKWYDCIRAVNFPDFGPFIRLSNRFQFALGPNFYVDNAIVNFDPHSNFFEWLIKSLGPSWRLGCLLKTKLDPVGRVTGLPVD